jgi:elongation factor Ts
MPVTAEMIKKLRELTGAGILECKKALEATDGDLKRAQEILREKGLAVAAKKADRVARQGLVDCYVHMGRIGALVEVNCETDFVARTPEFKELAHAVAMQVVGAQPQYLKPEDIPAAVLEEQKRICGDELDKFYGEVCLLKQLSIKDQSKTVQDLINEAVAKTGENIVLRRFARFELGGD